MTNKFKLVKEPGEIFASAITTEYVELNNHKTVDFVIATGVGTAANTTVKVKAKLGADGEAKDIEFKLKAAGDFEDVEATGKAISVGGTTGHTGFYVVRVDADKVGARLCDRVAVNTTAISNSTVPGSITACLYQARYSEQ